MSNFYEYNTTLLGAVQRSKTYTEYGVFFTPPVPSSCRRRCVWPRHPTPACPLSPSLSLSGAPPPSKRWTRKATLNDGATEQSLDYCCVCSSHLFGRLLFLQVRCSAGLHLHLSQCACYHGEKNAVTSTEYVRTGVWVHRGWGIFELFQMLMFLRLSLLHAHTQTRPSTDTSTTARAALENRGVVDTLIIPRVCGMRTSANNKSHLVLLS